jgi:DNA-binding transcriptional regulator LsrR (DeoR family)
MNLPLESSLANSKLEQQRDWLDLHNPFELVSRVASMYYLEEKSQIEVAKELGLSRQKVQRLLQQAKDQRIVEIHVHSVPILHVELERKLKELFGLQDVVIAPYHPDENYRRYSVARAAADYLERNLKDCSVVAIGLGRNTRETANFFRPTRQYDATFVSAMGGSPSLGAEINPSEICLKFASRIGRKAEILYAPAYLETRRAHDMLIAQETVKRTMDLARNADIALMGIGTATDDSILVQAGCLSLSEARRLRDMGVVGELLGNHYNEQGERVESDLNGRMISLSLDELRKIPLTIAVASEMEKSRAVLGALRTRALRTLIVECKLAVEVLRLAGALDTIKAEETLLGL